MHFCLFTILSHTWGSVETAKVVNLCTHLHQCQCENHTPHLAAHMERQLLSTQNKVLTCQPNQNLLWYWYMHVKRVVKFSVWCKDTLYCWPPNSKIWLLWMTMSVSSNCILLSRTCTKTFPRTSNEISRNCHTECEVLCPHTGTLWCQLSILLVLCLMPTFKMQANAHWFQGTLEQLRWDTIRSSSMSFP